MLVNERGCRIVCRTGTWNQQVKPQSIITLQYSVTAPQKIPIKGIAFFFFRSKKNLQWKLLSRILFNFVPSWPSVVIGLVNFFLKLEKMHRKCILWSILFHRRWPQRNPNLKIPTVSVFKICEIKHFKKVLPKRFPKVWNLVKNGSWGPQNSPKLRWQS